MLHAVIMAGGRGERFWPWSRAGSPKQLQKIIGQTTMLEQTVARVRPLVDNSRIWVVTNAEQAPAVRALLPGVPGRHVLEEPVGRNTAPAVALAAGAIEREDPEGIMAVLPADHVISPRSQFLSVIQACSRLAAESEHLITIGIKPRYPATGYGYIRRGREVKRLRGAVFYAVEEFREKPDRGTARKFLRSGRYSWNSGMFVWSIRAIAGAIARHLPRLGELLRPVFSAPLRRRRGLINRAYPRLPNISIDYGIMEKHPDVLMTPAGFHWDDVGSWDALDRHYPRDAHDNAVRGKCVALDSSGCVVATAGPLIALLGVSDLVVAATDDAVLVCPRSKAQDVKKLVQRFHEQRKYRRYV